ncbi:MAG: hypothetical protein H6759_02095 [Candidatus Nomurabacteria bacterium]|nr:MAG: hypothetical protein H6759_02095 [Candidatus Nomurabacteria bacterium]
MQAKLLVTSIVLAKKNSEEVSLVAGTKLRVPGEHNKRNAEIAAAIAFELGIKPTVIKKALKDFKGLENRIETIATIKGIEYINDTTATTPDGAMAAVNALQKAKRMVNILFGGANKELDFTEVSKLFKKRKRYSRLFVARYRKRRNYQSL